MRVLETIMVLIVMVLLVALSVVVHKYLLDGYMQRRGWVSKEKLLYGYPRYLGVPYDEYNQALDDVRKYIQEYK